MKDIQPKFNHDLKDDKSFPYLQIRTREDFPRVEFTREPRERASSSMGRSPVRAACGWRSKCCNGFSSSAPARLDIGVGRRIAGAGFGRACCTSSANAPHRAIFA